MIQSKPIHGILLLILLTTALLTCTSKAPPSPEMPQAAKSAQGDSSAPSPEAEMQFPQAETVVLFTPGRAAPEVPDFAQHASKDGIDPMEPFVLGDGSILEAILERAGGLQSIIPGQKLPARLGRYESGRLLLKNGESLEYLAYTIGNGPGTRIRLLVCGLGEKKADPTLDLDAIKNRRSEFTSIVNKGRGVRTLLPALYHPEAVYYRSGRSIQGHEALSREFSYMDVPGYSLRLTCLECTLVRPGLALETGRWSADGTSGPYILAWIKDSQGQWQLALDSNE